MKTRDSTTPAFDLTMPALFVALSATTWADVSAGEPVTGLEWAVLTVVGLGAFLINYVPLRAAFLRAIAR